MSGRQKVLLAVLGVLLVVLFGVAVGAGRGDRGDPAGRYSLVDLLGRAGGGTQAVEPATVDADCVESSGLLAVSGDCELRVADPGGLRTLILRSPEAFTVEAPAPGDAEFTIEDDVTPADDGTGAVARIAVDRATTVRVSCPGGCPVTIARD
ncbi:hypothetical protein [Micromonospora craniellae]|uniref:Uncharacterized protein n=1 Tax=Micromonospora craniellae TaxID=2294034 RepID=A0A372FZV8_9ACTN|nr:hypothetical protein [Micromonospora craniellae]QOC91438.1 hypothetical protein ID554_26275 [Micromonospora craniellae]RFS46238.1 hypothetical protein D0Q02_12325 [Micromonospora craniellae]